MNPSGSLAPNVQVDVRYGGGQPERITAVAKELVAAQPDVLEVETTPGTKRTNPRRFRASR